MAFLALYDYRWKPIKLFLYWNKRFLSSLLSLVNKYGSQAQAIGIQYTCQGRGDDKYPIFSIEKNTHTIWISDEKYKRRLEWLLLASHSAFLVYTYIHVYTIFQRDSNNKEELKFPFESSTANGVSLFFGLMRLHFNIKQLRNKKKNEDETEIRAYYQVFLTQHCKYACNICLTVIQCRLCASNVWQSSPSRISRYM